MVEISIFFLQFFFSAGRDQCLEVHITCKIVSDLHGNPYHVQNWNTFIDVVAVYREESSCTIITIIITHFTYRFELFLPIEGWCHSHPAPAHTAGTTGSVITALPSRRRAEIESCHCNVQCCFYANCQRSLTQRHNSIVIFHNMWTRTPQIERSTINF